MFKVRETETGKVYTVYAVAGTRFLVFLPEDGGHWEWRYMMDFVPAEK